MVVFFDSNYHKSVWRKPSCYVAWEVSFLRLLDKSQKMTEFSRQKNQSINQSSIKQPQAIARFAESSANDKQTGSGKRNYFSQKNRWIIALKMSFSEHFLTRNSFAIVCRWAWRECASLIGIKVARCGNKRPKKGCLPKSGLRTKRFCVASHTVMTNFRFFLFLDRMSSAQFWSALLVWKSAIFNEKCFIKQPHDFAHRQNTLFCLWILPTLESQAWRAAVPCQVKPV